MVKMILTGNETAAYAAKVCRVKVVAAYPITPQTNIVEKIAELIANGEMDARYVRVESEHSAMAACIAVSNANVRTFTATSAHGLTLMHEMLIWASGARLPIVMVVVNRAMAPPWSVWADQYDSMAQRDTGWMQVYAESNQEVMDSIIMAYKVSENVDVLLPTMVMEDAFILSHTSEPVEVPTESEVDSYLPEINIPHRIDPTFPAGYGSLIMPEGPYMEFRYKIAEAMDRARKVIIEECEEFERKFGRHYDGLVEFYKTDDADVNLIMLGTMSSTAKDVVDSLREEGKKVGLLRIRYFRPFPFEEILSVARTSNYIGVCDRSYTFGYGGPIWSEVRAAAYPSKVYIKNYVVGLGGRDVTPEVLRKIYEDALKMREDREIEWVGLLWDRK